MRITEVSLQGFRNISQLHLIPSDGINIICGSNAQGKTNFLESLYFCAVARSMRGKSDQQLIAFDSAESHIRLSVRRSQRIDRIDVHLKREEKAGRGHGKGVAVNGVPLRRLGELFGTLYAVVFSPEDLSLVKDGPAERRRFLDMELCQLSRVYFYDLQQYTRILRQRNNLLKGIQKKPALEETLFVWDGQLVDYGERIIAARARFLERMDGIAAEKLRQLTGGQDSLKTAYHPNCALGLMAERLQKKKNAIFSWGRHSAGRIRTTFCLPLTGGRSRLTARRGSRERSRLRQGLRRLS